MVSSLQRLLGGCTCLLLIHAAQAAQLTPSEKIQMPLNALLQHDCAAKHLDLLDPSDFNAAVGPFRTSLSSAERQTLDQTADPAKTCANSTAEASCENLAYIKAATKLKLLPLFASKICTLPLVCRAQSQCSESHS